MARGHCAHPLSGNVAPDPSLATAAIAAYHIERPLTRDECGAHARLQALCVRACVCMCCCQIDGRPRADALGPTVGYAALSIAFWRFRQYRVLYPDPSMADRCAPPCVRSPGIIARHARRYAVMAARAEHMAQHAPRVQLQRDGTIGVVFEC